MLDLLDLDPDALSDDEVLALATVIEAEEQLARWIDIADTFPRHDERVWPFPYDEVLEWRRAAAALLTADPGLRVGAFEYYRQDRPIEFTEHWGMTFDPRNGKGARKHLPRKLPMLLFKRQRELFDFLLACMNGSGDGLIEKARDMGATWVACFFSIWLWTFHSGSAVGWGSRKEELVDHRGDPKCVFEKLRMGIELMPDCFKPAGFSPREHMTFMTIVNPQNGSTIIGEAGDNIGRGGRTGIYFKDESAHYVRPESIEAALGDNTDVQIDISSVNGLGNVFHRRRESGKDWVPGTPVEDGDVGVFVMDWRDHPGKSPEWHERRRLKAEREGLLHVFKQEVDRDYAASVEGVIIPAEWVKSAIDAHLLLGIGGGGHWSGALDVADDGGDTNADAFFEGIILREVANWGARDTGITTNIFIEHAKDKGEIELQYDAIGVGSGVKSEANRLEDEGLLPPRVRLVPWFASASPDRADKPIIEDDPDSPLNGDFFQNLKAQAWWNTRIRFEKTHRAVQAAIGLGEPFTWKPEELISIDGSIPLLRQIEKELSQPTRKPNTPKLVIDKKPEGTRSPNLADAIIMAANPVNGLKPIITVARNQFEATPFRIPPHFAKGYAIYVSGQSCHVLWGAWDKESDILYITTEYEREHAEVGLHAQAVTSRGKWIPGVFDSDETNLRKQDEMIRLYVGHGLTRIIPADKAIEAGIGDLQQRIGTRRLVAFSTCQGFWRDYRAFRRDADGKIVGGGFMHCARMLARPDNLRRMIVEPSASVLGQQRGVHGYVA